MRGQRSLNAADPRRPDIIVIAGLPIIRPLRLRASAILISDMIRVSNPVIRGHSDFFFLTVATIPPVDDKTIQQPH